MLYRLPKWLSGKNPSASVEATEDVGSKIPWRRKWQPTPVFLHEKLYEQRSLVSCSPWGLKELDMTATEHACMHSMLTAREDPGSGWTGCSRTSEFTSQEARLQLRLFLWNLWTYMNWSESQSVMSNSLQPHGPYSLWIFPGQNTRVGSLSLLQGIFPTQGSNPGLLHYQLSHKGSTIILEWVAYRFSSRSSQLRD